VIDVARAFVRKSEGRLSPARKTTEARLSLGESLLDRD